MSDFRRILSAIAILVTVGAMLFLLTYVFQPRLEPWPLPLADPPGLPSNEVHAIRSEGDGEVLWFATAGGVTRVEGASGRTTTYSAWDGLASNQVSALLPQPGTGRVWIGAGGGIQLLDPSIGVVDERSLGPPRRVRPSKRLYRPALDILGIYREGNGLLVNAGKSGFYRLTPDETEAAIHVPYLVQYICTAAYHEEDRDRLWVAQGSPSGLRRSVYHFDRQEYDPWTENDERIRGEVEAIYRHPDGGIWIGTEKGLYRLDPETQSLSSFTESDGLADDHILEIRGGPDERTLWLGTRKSGAWSFDPSTRRSEPLAVRQIPFEESLNPRPRLALLATLVVRSRPGGLLFTAKDAAHGATVAVPIDAPVMDLAPGPGDRVWVGTQRGGLRLQGADGSGRRLTTAGGLPSMDVHTLAAVPGSGGRRVWAATADGAALASTDETGLRVERTWTSEDGLPAGPVDALVPLADGSLFLAWNVIRRRPVPGETHDQQALTRQRLTPQVRYLPATGPPGAPIFLPVEGRLWTEIHQLAFSDRGDGTLWVATSKGLFKARNPRQPEMTFETVGEREIWRQINALEVDPLGRVWLALGTRRTRYDYPSPFGRSDGSILGYRDDTGGTVTLEPRHGVPNGFLDDLAFSEKGEIVVLSGSRLARGKVQVPWFGRRQLRSYVNVLMFAYILIVVWKRMRPSQRRAEELEDER